MAAGSGSPGRRGFPPAVAIALLVLAVALGVGGGSLLASSVRPAGTPSPSGTQGALGATVTPGGPSQAPTASPTTAPTPGPTPVPTPTMVPAPLTGLPVTAAAARLHPIAVMVDDHRDARPQSGFNSAAIVWQAPAEGGIPRYMMIFQDRIPDAVGPVRSSRQYYIEWAAELHAVYAHAGGSPQALATLRAQGQGQLVWNVEGLRFDGSDMWRVTTRVAPHNLYTDGRHLRAMARIVGAQDGPVPSPWTFGAATSGDARPVGTRLVVQYPYETITYRYDPVSNTYLRFIDASKTPQVDAADGSPVAPTNVVILRMRFGPLNDGHPQKHRLEAQDIGRGDAIISTNGLVIHGTWKKASAGAPTLLYGPDGSPVELTPGQTFVQVIALSYPYKVIQGAAWPTGLRYS